MKGKYPWKAIRISMIVLLIAWIIIDSMGLTPLQTTRVMVMVIISMSIGYVIGLSDPDA